MFSYYTVVLLMCWISLGTLCILIRENARIPRKDKRLLYLTYALIAESALAEWLGVQLDGQMQMPVWFLIMAKAADYMLTPMAGGAVVLQLRQENRLQDVINGLLIFNLVFQLIGVFNGWTVTVDAAHYYGHGSLYWLYILICLAIIALMMAKFMIYGHAFRRKNRNSLYAIMLLVLLGFYLQEGTVERYRTIYLALTLGAILIFIHYTEFSALALDEHLAVQKIQIDTDALTGVLSRYAYSEALNRYEKARAVPRDLAVFTLDINGLKAVNDNLGHDAGDEIIKGAAECIEAVFSSKGECYRTGGDEFVVLARMNRGAADAALQKLRDVTGQWRGEKVGRLGISAGYALAADHPEMSVEEMVKLADQAMYAAKAAYYRSGGHDRRKSRQ